MSQTSRSISRHGRSEASERVRQGAHEQSIAEDDEASCQYWNQSVWFSLCVDKERDLLPGFLVFFDPHQVPCWL